MKKSSLKRYLARLTIFFFLGSPAAPAQSGGELRFALRADPKTFNPLAVEDEPAETVRYLTTGVLMRVNRKTQKVEPRLAESWEIVDGGRTIRLRLRKGVVFSDGTAFTAEDVAFTMRELMDPDLHSPTGDSFRSSAGEVEVDVAGPHELSIRFPAPVAGVERLFDQVPMLSSEPGDEPEAGLGPYLLDEHKAGSYVLLKRNPRYWKRDDKGRRLPYLDTVRLEVQRNQQIEMLRFRRGRFHVINSVAPEHFDRLQSMEARSVHDAGPSLNSEFLWFNQVPGSPLPAYKKRWFGSAVFRRAVSGAINRDDLVRVVYRGRGEAATGPVSPANRFWFNRKLAPHAFDPASAKKRLKEDGFRRDGDALLDAEGHPVEFSLITNAGNKGRERMAAMIQQDLAKLGIRLNIVTLDFPSLIERITRSFEYEACLLGLVNVDLDPNAQMNVWLSSGRSHQWNPMQKEPATPWEAEIDGLMRRQASVTEPAKRKAAFDRVQQIVWEQAPFIYLVHRNALSAVSPRLRNVEPGVLWPQTFWNAERIYFDNAVAEGRD